MTDHLAHDLDAGDQREDQGGAFGGVVALQGGGERLEVHLLDLLAADLDDARIGGGAGADHHQGAVEGRGIRVGGLEDAGGEIGAE